MEKKKTKKKTKKGSGLKLFGKILLGIFLFLFLLILFIRSHWGQNIITDRLVSYISDKTGTEVQIDKAFISFGGDLNLQGLYLEDQNGDTLLYSRSFEADMPLLPVLKGKGFSIDNVEWKGVTANIRRQDTTGGFNYEFLINALTPAGSPSAPADTASGTAFSIGDFNLEDFKVDFVDRVQGIDLAVDLGSLQVKMREFDPDSMVYRIAEAKLAHTTFAFEQRETQINTPQENAPAPFVSIGRLDVQDLNGRYNSVPDGISAKMDIADLLLEMPKADLGKQVIKIENFELNDSEIALQLQASENPKEATSTEVSGGFWPQWNINIEQVNLQDNRLSYTAGMAAAPDDAFDPENLDFQNLSLKADQIVLEEGLAAANVTTFQFLEPSGLRLHQASFQARITEEESRLTDLQFHLNQNRIRGDLVLDYASLEEFLADPQGVYAHTDIPAFSVDLKDLFPILPTLKNNEYLTALSEKRLSGSLRASGRTQELKIDRLELFWGKTTAITGSGKIFNATRPDQIAFDLPNLSFRSTRADIATFIDEKALGIQIPSTLSGSGNIAGSPEDMEVTVEIASSLGDISVDGHFQTAPQIAFSGEVEAKTLQVGDLVQMKSLGPVSFDLVTAGEGRSIDSLDATLEGNISSFLYNGYEFQDIALYAKVEDGAGYAEMDYKDHNLNVKMNSFIQLDSVSPKIATSIDVIGADLLALGLVRRPINTAMELQATFEGNMERFDVVGTISDGIFVYDNESYLLGDVDLMGHVRGDTTAISVRNRTLNLQLNSNASPNEFIDALLRHYQSYYGQADAADTLSDPVNINFMGEIRPSPVLSEVFLPKMDELDTLNVDVEFHEKERQLQADISLPFISYWGSKVDSLEFHLDSGKAGLAFDFGLKNLEIGPLDIHRTLLQGRLSEEQLEMEFTSSYQDSLLVHVLSEVTKEDDIVQIHLNPDSLILNGRDWRIDPANEILLKDSLWVFNAFEMSRDQQLLRVSNSSPGVVEPHIAMGLQNFELSTLFSYLNPEAVLASGIMNGNLVIKEPFGSTALLADVNILDFGISGVDLGDLTLEAESRGGNTYEFDLAIREGQADLDLTGTYLAGAEAASLDLLLDLNKIEMEVIQGFSFGEITESSGSFSGQVKLSGTIAEPEYRGNLHFNDATARIAALDAPFTFPDEELTINNQELSLQDFDIMDVNGNRMTLNGIVQTDQLLNPDFDLRFDAENFTLMSASAEDNELLYGTAVVNAEGHLGGNLELPEIDVNLDVLEQSNITYVIPEAELQLEQRKGVVIFVNRENPDMIITRNTDQEETFAFEGFALNSQISVEEGATMTIVLDDETGDHLQASGEGDLLFNMYPNGRQTLTGRLEINDGHYEMSLYDLVSRRFEIMDGSSIVWAGDPMDADLNINAVYQVETSASSLMAPQLTGASMDVRSRFRQELEFLVYLRITGQIDQPKISFGLGMPESEQGALSGQVYSRIQQINTQDAELNKQVFSLLVLNRFFPAGGSAGTEGGTLSFARDNLNDALSDQLNVYSERLLDDYGIDLNFGLDSYTDYQGLTPEERTQLDVTAERALFNDRLIVKVGSEVNLQGTGPVNEPTPLIGNLSLEYLLTPDGQFALEAFRRKTYENVIDGQLIITGLSLIFTTEFNHFRELLSGIVDQAKKEKEQRSSQ